MFWALRAPFGPPAPPPGTPKSIEVFRASPRFLAQRLALHFGSALSIIGFETLAWLWAPDSTWLSRRISLYIVVGTTLAALLRYLVIRLEYDLRFYMLSNRCLRIRRGAVIIEESTYTLANVQTVALRQGPLDRLFGICDLHIETAGGGSGEVPHESQSRMFHRGRLEGIATKQAHALRDRLLAALATYRDSGLGEIVQQRSAQRMNNLGKRRQADFSKRSLGVLRAIRAQLQLINQREISPPQKNPK